MFFRFFYVQKYICWPCMSPRSLILLLVSGVITSSVEKSWLFASWDFATVVFKEFPSNHCVCTTSTSLILTEFHKNSAVRNTNSAINSKVSTLNTQFAKRKGFLPPLLLHQHFPHTLSFVCTWISCRSPQQFFIIFCSKPPEVQCLTAFWKALYSHQHLGKLKENWFVCVYCMCERKMGHCFRMIDTCLVQQL